jgi:hypothetical protein
LEGQVREVKGEGEEGRGDDCNEAHPIYKTGGETQQ